MPDRKQDIKAAWLLSAALACSSFGLLLIEMFVGNPAQAVTRWGLVATFAGLSFLSAGWAFRLMTESRGGWPETSTTMFYGGRPDYQLMGFGAAITLVGMAMHVADRLTA